MIMCLFDSYLTFCMKSFLICNHIISFLNDETIIYIHRYRAFISFLHLTHLFLEYFYCLWEVTLCCWRAVSEYVQSMWFTYLSGLHPNSRNHLGLGASLITLDGENICHFSSAFFNPFDGDFLLVDSSLFKILEKSMNKPMNFRQNFKLLKIRSSFRINLSSKGKDTSWASGSFF